MTRSTTTKRNAKSIVFPCVLKTIINDAMRDKTIVDDNAKKIRAKLRVAFRDTHHKNTSWIAMNMRDYDAIRDVFDNVYRERRVASRKRNAKKNVAPSHDVANVDAE